MRDCEFSQHLQKLNYNYAVCKATPTSGIHFQHVYTCLKLISKCEANASSLTL